MDNRFMKIKPAVGMFADDNVGWTAGALYLRGIAKTVGQLPEPDRPNLPLLISRKANRQKGNAPDRTFDKIILFDRQPKNRWKALMAAVSRTVDGFRKPVSLADVVLQNQISCLLPCQSSLGQSFPVPWVGWIPDFQHTRCPEYFSEQEIRVRNTRFQTLIDDATLTVVSSQDAKNDLLTSFRADPEKICVYSFSTHMEPEWLLPDPAQFTKQLKLPEKYVMFPSQFWKHKNHLNLLMAIKQVKRQHSDIALVLTGNESDFRHPEYAGQIKAELTSPELRDHVFWLGLLARHEQIQVMRRAAAIIQPSYFEGWSMLVEDCRALGKQIILSDIPVHREQSPTDATFFNPTDIQQLANILLYRWPQLSPGPDRLKEKSAQHLLAYRHTANAARLKEIIDKAIQ
ncbi:MAG: glycosyltransferase family 4 protein [Pirellulales bacterium]|jgi:glycosyltransferase involved in cell wall biosynthesis